MAGFPQPAMTPPAPSPVQTATSPVEIVGPQYLAPYPVDLSIVEKSMTLSDGSFDATDINGNVIFKIKGKLVSLHDRRTLRDAADNPILTFQKKLLSAHRRWQVFRGDSADAKDLLFNVKRSAIMQLKTTLDVFLDANEKEEICDFKVKGTWSEGSCTIYVGESNNIIAHMHEKETAQSYFFGKETFSVTVYPNVDYIFIVALVVILNEITGDKED